MRIFKLGASLLIVLGAVSLIAFLIELICAAAYFMEKGKISRPPILGGVALWDRKNPDTYDFSPLSIFVNKADRRQEGLFAQYDIKLPPKSRKYRVFILGGSTLANERKPRGDRISDHIEKTLLAKGISAEVFNFGVPNYTSINELYLTLSTLVYYEPDLVISYNGVNDAFYGATLKRELWRPNVTDMVINYRSRLNSVFSMPPAQRLRYFLEAFSYTYYFVARLSEGPPRRQIDSLTPEEFSKLVDQDTERRIRNPPIRFAATMIRPDIYADNAKYNVEAVNVYRNNIVLMAASLDVLGISYLHVLQPTAFTKKVLYPREKWSLDFNNSYFRDFQQVMTKTLEDFGRAQQEVARNNSLERASFLNLRNFTDSLDEYLYDDYCHEYIGGRLTALIGEAIGEHIVRAFRLI